jgi:hypothetical protein
MYFLHKTDYDETIINQKFFYFCWFQLKIRLDFERAIQVTELIKKLEKDIKAVRI